jgi:hypothetical protein
VPVFPPTPWKAKASDVAQSMAPTTSEERTAAERWMRDEDDDSWWVMTIPDLGDDGPA